MDSTVVLLDSNTLQKDLRIRMPKQILSNLPVKIGDVFNIYLNPSTQEIILRIAANDHTDVTLRVGEGGDQNEI